VCVLDGSGALCIIKRKWDLRVRMWSGLELWMVVVDSLSLVLFLSLFPLICFSFCTPLISFMNTTLDTTDLNE